MIRIILLLMALSLAGCGEEGAVQKAAKKSLIDPDSAKFGKFTHVDSLACLDFNAKNKYGGYTGFTTYIFWKVESSGEWLIHPEGKYDTHDECVYIIDGVISLREKEQREEQEKQREEQRYEESIAPIKKEFRIIIQEARNVSSDEAARIAEHDDCSAAKDFFISEYSNTDRRDALTIFIKKNGCEVSPFVQWDSRKKEYFNPS